MDLLGQHGQDLDQEGHGTDVIVVPEQRIEESVSAAAGRVQNLAERTFHQFDKSGT